MQNYLKSIYLVVIIILVVSACAPSLEEGNEEIPFTIPTPKPLFEVRPIEESEFMRDIEAKSGLLAIITPDRNILVTNQIGEDAQFLTTDAVVTDMQSGEFVLYNLPVWSHADQKLAYVRYEGWIEGDQVFFSSTSIFIHELNNQPPIEVYNNTEGEEPLTLAWSPDDKSLIFTSQANYRVGNNLSGLYLIPALQQVDIETGAIRAVEVDTRVAWSWFPDSYRLLMHAGIGSEQSLSIIHLGEVTTEENLDVFPSGSNAPAVSPDGAQIVFSARNPTGGQSLYLADQAGNNAEVIGTFGISTSYVWSPDGNFIAYIANEKYSRETRGTFHVHNLNDPENSFRLPEEDVISIFWSPDSSKLAYFVIVPREVPEGVQVTSAGEIEVRILDMDKLESISLIRFLPSADFDNILRNFDLHQSITSIWSPNNERITITGELEQGEAGRQVWVMAVNGKTNPRTLFQGVYGVWSWD